MAKKNKTATKQQSSKEYHVITKYPSDYKLFDIRATKPICYKDSPIVGSDASMVLQEIDVIEFTTKINGKQNKLQYYSPNNVGILLSISNKSLLKAKEVYDHSLNPDKVDHLNGNGIEWLINKSSVVYDYIENIQTAIVFGYTALEAFTNLSIPVNYEFKSEPNNKGVTEIYDKEAIERWLPLRTKISQILLEVYDTPSITQKNIWNKFLQFEEMRHEIIHQKSINQTNFYKKYFKTASFDLCCTPEEIIKFFYEERKNKEETNPLWPWIINTSNDFPISYNYKPENFEVIGNTYEGWK